MTPEEHTIKGSSSTYARKVWFLPPVAKRPSRMAMFLDGEYYVDRMDAPALICELQRTSAIPPTVCVFVSHVDGAARHADFACNPRYSDFIVRDVVPWIKARYADLPAGAHLIAGPSLSGLAAAFITLTYPQLFSRCLGHSGSFWWNREWLRTELDKISPSQSKFWLSVGRRENQSGVVHPPSGMLQEVTQISACARFAEALAARQHQVHYHVYEGGHEIAPWKEELPDALRWLMH